MAIDDIGQVGQIGFGALSPKVNEASTEEALKSFGDVFKGALNDVNISQLNADESVARLAAGDAIDTHDVAIAVEKANLSLQLAIQVRNKIVEAYQEVMRMQV